MKLATWQIEFRSLLIGILLATCAFFLFAGAPSRANQNGIQEISAGDGGVYIVIGNVVYWRGRDQCGSPGGCRP